MYLKFRCLRHPPQIGVKGTWNKCEWYVHSRLCRESPLTPAQMVTLGVAGYDGFWRHARLPHGECGVRGGAPKVTDMLIVLLSNALQAQLGN